MYVLGSADVFVGEILVESATPGALLGEMALVDSTPRRHGGCHHAGAPGQDRLSAVSIFLFNRRPISLRT